MIRHILTVSTGTLASRLLGFSRDALMAALLGAGPVADAFLVAFQLINVARRLLTEGALNAALVPAYWRVRDRGGIAAAAAFAGRVLGTVSLAVFTAALVLGLVMPLAIATLAPGFAGQPAFTDAIADARLMLPYLAFAGPVAVMMSLLNAEHRFALAAFSPLLFNLALIAATVALLLWPHDPARAALLLAATVGAAGLLQLAVLAAGRARRMALPIRIGADSEMRGFFASAIPGMIAGAAPQLLMIAAAVIASASPAAVSWLYFANRLIELPLGIVGTAMGTVLVPELTRATRDGGAAFARAASHALELAVGLALPATLGLVLLGEPIVKLLFEHGAFTAADSQATASALAWLALGLPAHVLAKVLAPGFFARGDTRTPMLATVSGLAVTVAAGFLLHGRFGSAGIAAALALAAWISALHLMISAAAHSGLSIEPATRRRLPRIALAAAVMALLLWGAAGAAAPWLTGGPLGARAAAVGVAIAGGIIVYGAALALLGVIRLREIAAMRRRRPD